MVTAPSIPLIMPARNLTACDAHDDGAQTDHHLKGDPGTRVLEVTQLEKGVCKSEAAPFGGDPGSRVALETTAPLLERNAIAGRRTGRIAVPIPPIITASVTAPGRPTQVHTVGKNVGISALR
jgi:hypothetical protein